MPSNTIGQVRDLYLNQFRQVLASTPNAHLEPALRNSNGELALDGSLQLPYRADVIPRGGSGSIMVDSPTRASIPSETQSIAGVLVTINSFLWDQARFELSGLAQEADWSPLRTWFLRWFDGEDSNQVNEEGFYGVVHCALDPEATSDGYGVTIDFGSAPIDAFVECLEALAVLRPQQIEVV